MTKGYSNRLSVNRLTQKRGSIQTDQGVQSIQSQLHDPSGLTRRNGVLLTDWLPYSPDLNPIENLWKILKQRICDTYPEIVAYPKSVAALERLVEAAQEVWSEIEDEVVKNQIKSIPDRLNACYHANGYYTKY
jgi:hypothetical protein